MGRSGPLGQQVISGFAWMASQAVLASARSSAPCAAWLSWEYRCACSRRPWRGRCWSWLGDGSVADAHARAQRAGDPVGVRRVGRVVRAAGAVAGPGQSRGRDGAASTAQEDRMSYVYRFDKPRAHILAALPPLPEI